MQYLFDRVTHSWTSEFWCVFKAGQSLLYINVICLRIGFLCFMGYIHHVYAGHGRVCTQQHRGPASADGEVANHRRVCVITIDKSSLVREKVRENRENELLEEL